MTVVDTVDPQVYFIAIISGTKMFYSDIKFYIFLLS